MKTISQLTFISLLIIMQTNTSLFSQNLNTKKFSPIQNKLLKSTDIGNPAIVGSTKILNDKIEIIAGGADVWNKKDEFHFVFFFKKGNFDVVTRIESLEGTAHKYTKAGIMAREELTSGSKHIYFQVFPTNEPRNNNNGGYEFQYRLKSNENMKAIYPTDISAEPQFPVNYPTTWIRLQRIGNQFTGFYSADGINWKVYTVFSMEISEKLFLGLALTSHNAEKSAKAVFVDFAEIKK